MKRDIVTSVIYYYITTDFHYAKRNSRLSAYGGVMLQRVCIEKNINRDFNLNFSKFCNKRTDSMPCRLFYIHLTFQRDLRPFKQFTAF